MADPAVFVGDSDDAIPSVAVGGSADVVGGMVEAYVDICEMKEARWTGGSGTSPPQIVEAQALAAALL
jgi:hypothetical protein